MTNGHQDRYILEERLGAGAMGDVWLATDSLLDRPVAIKYLKATKDPRIKQLFFSEAKTLAKLNHPNITLIHDAVFDEAQNRFYIIMEYVKGEPLSDIIRQWTGAIPLEMILDITIGLVEALEFAHAHGIVHRDIKPANVILQTDGVQLTDFGIAGLMSLLAEGSDYIVGTPAYISPEQIEGLPLDGRADLYSLGIMLFEMTSGGERPFNYSSQTELFTAHLEEVPPHLKSYSPDIPFAFERAIMRLLEKEPDARYQSATELLAALQSIKARQKFSQPHLQLLDADAKPLLGREAELQQLGRIWADTQSLGHPHLVVVQGPPGMGKSHLITEFLGHSVIDNGLPAIAGRCDEAGVPYAPFAEILGTIFNHHLLQASPTQSQLNDLVEQIPDLSRILNLTDSKVLTTVSRRPKKKSESTTTSGLWQALTERVPEGSPSLNDDNSWQFSKMILDFLADAGPLVIFLEDADYLDEASAALIRFLVRQEHLPLMVIATRRDGAQPPAWLKTFSVNEASTLNLSPLPPSVIKAYLTELLQNSPADEVVALVEERSQGNPLAVAETTHQLIEASALQQDKAGVWHRAADDQLADAFLPQAVIGAFKRQIDKLTDSSREALTLAAMIEPGPEFDLEIWRKVLARIFPTNSMQAALEEALKKRLLRQLEPTRYVFRPPDVSNALRATLTGTRRHELHQKIATLLEKIGGEPVLVAYHHEQAGSPAIAAKVLEQAGVQAEAENAVDVAVNYYQRAAKLDDSPTVYKTIGELQQRQGNHSEAVRAYEQTIALATAAGDVDNQALALNGLALTLCLDDQLEAAQPKPKKS